MGSQTSRDDRQKVIDPSLVRFGERLKCHGKFYEDGMQLAERVFKTLQQHSQFYLASFHIGGSFGKKTDVIEPDLDLVVLVNKCHPPLDDVLDDFEVILFATENYLQIRGGVYKRTDRSLKFSFRNGISVDLLPATNLRGNERNDVIARMGQDENFAYFYNPSFVKDQIAFMKAQDSFAHTLVRLSKFWFKSLYLGESFSGGSAVMELIAVAAAESEEENGERSASRGFIRVLDMVINLNTTKIAFKTVNPQQWKRVPSAELSIRNASQLVPKTVGSSRILQQSCFIVDPANPSQNFLEEKPDSVFEKLNKFARETRSVLDKVLNGNGRHGQDKFIQELFEPMFENLDNVLLPKYILVSFDVPCKSVYNKLKIWDKGIDYRKEDAAHVIKKNLLTVIHSTVKGNENTSVSDVEDAVSHLLKNRLHLAMSETSDLDRHNHEFEAMIRIPYVINSVGHSVYLSMSWKPNWFRDLWHFLYCFFKSLFAPPTFNVEWLVKVGIIIALISYILG